MILDLGVWSKDERSALRWLAAEVGADSGLVYLPISEAEQRRRIEARFAAEPGATFAVSSEELDEFRRLFQVPDQDELDSLQVDRPPAGYHTWASWASERWPSSVL